MCEFSVSKAQFQKYCANCSHQYTESDVTKNKAWIVAASWCIKRYINDSHFLPSDKSWPSERLNNPRTPTCALVQNRNVRKDAAPTSYNTLEIRSIFPIAIEQERFIDYGPDRVHRG